MARKSLNEERENDRRVDGWVNTITGLGTARSDPAVHTVFRSRQHLDMQTLDSLYTQSGVAGRISDLPAQYATKDWCSIVTNDEELDEKIEEAVEKMNVRSHVSDLIRWSRHYGGAGAFVAANDGLDPSEPLGGNMREILGFDTFDRFDMADAEYKRLIKPERVERWRLRHEDGSRSVVHRSRMILLPGLARPKRRASEVEGWGWSLMDRVVEELSAFMESHKYAANIIRDFTQDVFKIENLSALIASGKESQLQDRFRIIRLGRSILNAVIIGKEEEYEKRSTTSAGTKEILEQLERLLSLVTGIPISLLFGRSAAGLNATGENDVRQFYDLIQSFQTERLTHVVRAFVDLILLSKAGPTGGRLVPYQVEWLPLWKMSALEEAQIEKLHAERDSINVAARIVEPEEVALTRYNAPKATYTLIDGMRDTAHVKRGLREEPEEGYEE